MSDDNLGREIHVHVHVDHGQHELAHKLDRIEQGIEALQAQGAQIMTDLTALDAAVAATEAAVAEDTAIDSSAALLLDQIGQILRDNATDPAAITAFADRLSASTAAGVSSNAALVAAIAANTQPA